MEGSEAAMLPEAQVKKPPTGRLSARYLRKSYIITILLLLLVNSENAIRNLQQTTFWIFFLIVCQNK